MDCGRLSWTGNVTRLSLIIINDKITYHIILLYYYISPSQMSTLDSFLISSRRPPEPSAVSQEIRDRGSLFVASVFPASTVPQVHRATAHLRNVLHASKPATHDVAAWRCMVLRKDKTGLGGPDDFELVVGFEDDGEAHAGRRVLQVMQAEGVIDAVVVVSRW